MSKITLDQIQEVLTPLNWTIVSESYTNLNTEMHFRCAQGHDIYTSWAKLRNKIECPTCKAREAVFATNEIKPKPKGATRILALDQASHNTGYAIFDNDTLISSGVFETNASAEIERIAAIKEWLRSMLMNWRPDYVGLEGIQFQDESSGRKMGVTVFETLARLQGVLMVLCYEQNIPCMVCPTNTWRHTIGVKGKARADRKRSMQMLVKQWYQIDVSDDVADAIGIGYYVVHAGKQTSLNVENWET